MHPEQEDERVVVKNVGFERFGIKSFVVKNVAKVIINSVIRVVKGVVNLKASN